MARFTDSIVNFSPYIPQLPVDDYVRVGLQKQAQYNEGVSRTQQYIDSVAGIDVIKPEQKEYLQQRVGQLQGAVSNIVSQDFSNQQLVNSVGNLTGKIAGDPIIQNAVYSTQRYRQGLSDMKEAKEKGTLSPSNEYVFQKKANDWLSDGDAKSSFTGEYEPYTDTKKPILDAINALKPGENITDIPYETDSQGNYVLDSRGQRKIAYATIREKMEGVSEARIKQAIEASITPQMKRQFQIDGEYNYRGVDKVGLKKMADDSYGYRLGQVNDIIQGLTVQANSNQNNPDRVRAIQQEIGRYQSAARDLQNQYKQDVEFLDKNPDAYKGELHYQDELSKYTLGYSWSKHSLTYENNPIFNGLMKEKEYNLNWDKFKEMSEYHRDMLGIRAREADIKEEALRLKYGFGGQGGGSFKLDTPFSEGISQAELENINISTLQDAVTSMSNDLDDQKMKAIAQMDGGQNWITNRDGKLIYKDAKSKDAAEVAFKTLKEAYDKDPSKVSPALQTYFSNYSTDDNVIKNYKAVSDKIMKDANDRFGTKNLTKGIPGLKFKTSSGQDVSMSAEELLDLAEKLDKQGKKYPDPRLADAHSANDLLTLKGLREPEGRSPEDEKAFWAPFSDNEKRVIDAYNKGDKSARAVFGKALERLSSSGGQKMLSDRDDYIQTEARRAYTQNQGATFPIVAYKAADATRAKAAFVQIINDEKSRGIENANPNFDQSDIVKMLDEKNARGTTYSLHAKPDGTYSVRFSNTSISTKPREMDITADQASKWFGTFVNQFRPIQQAINLSKYNGVGATTDVRGEGRESAYSIPQTEQLKNYSVKYHVEEPYQGQYQLKLYIYDKKAKQWMPERYADFGGRMLNQQQIMAAVNNLSDSEVGRLYGKKQTSGALPSYNQNFGGPMSGIPMSQDDLQDIMNDNEDNLDIDPDNE